MFNKQNLHRRLIVLSVILLYLILHVITYSGTFQKIKPYLSIPQFLNKVPVPPSTLVKRVNESFRLWDMEYEVMSAVDYGSKYGYQTTSGKYIMVKIKATNVGKTEANLSKIFIQDSKDRQYQFDPMMLDVASALPTYGLYKNYSGIPAGFSEMFVAVFEVPKDSTGLLLNYPSAQGNTVLSVQLGI